MILPWSPEDEARLTDDEMLQAYIDAGLGEDYGRFCIEVIRGRHVDENGNPIPIE